MAALNNAELYKLAKAAGFGQSPSFDMPDGKGGHERTSAIDVAVAVAVAESGGYADATNHNANGTTDYGLWQINSVHLQPGGDLRARFTTADLLDPAKNAEAAFIVSKGGTSWRPWVAYTSGRAWQARQAIKADTDPSLAEQIGGKVAGAAVGALDPLSSITSAVGAIMSAVLDVGWWTRVAIALASIAVGVAGAMLVVNDSLGGAVQGAAKIAGAAL